MCKVEPEAYNEIDTSQETLAVIKDFITVSKKKGLTNKKLLEEIYNRVLKLETNRIKHLDAKLKKQDKVIKELCEKVKDLKATIK